MFIVMLTHLTPQLNGPFSVFQGVKMGSCTFCKVHPRELKSCICKKVSYCSRDCQAKDWKTIDAVWIIGLISTPRRKLVEKMVQKFI